MQHFPHIGTILQHKHKYRNGDQCHPVGPHGPGRSLTVFYFTVNTAEMASDCVDVGIGEGE